MAERRRSIDHSTVHRWVINLLPAQEKGFRRRTSPIGKPVSGESGGRSTDYESTSSSNRPPIVGGETTAVLQKRPLNSRPVEGLNWVDDGHPYVL